MNTAQQDQDRRALREATANWSRAVEARKLEAIVEAYTPQTVLFDAIPPYRSVGAEAIKATWAQCLPQLPQRFRSEHRDLTIEVDGDLAFVFGLHRFTAERSDDPNTMSWMRVTVCLRRIDGQWKVLHEHVSVPFDPVTGRAAFIRDPSEAPPMRPI